MKEIIIPTAEQIVETNKEICRESGSSHHCYGIGKIESSIFTAFYPGSYPFAAGGIAKIAGALCYYIVKNHAFMDGNKRTGAITAIAFMTVNGWSLKYPRNEATSEDALADIIEGCAAGNVSKVELIGWFEEHKIVKH